MRGQKVRVVMLALSLAFALFSYAYGASLDFDPTTGYTVESAIVDGKTIQYRAYTNIPYVANPVPAWVNGQSVNYQVMNIYIPVEYFEGKSVNGYTAETAPILFINGVGGYMPALPIALNPDATDDRTKTMLLALSKGFVVVSPGARGRTLQDVNGKYIGKAPAVIVDLKAAVRYLRYNESRMPGDADKIIPTGVSAGGAVTALLGATGNHPDYESYLSEIGAANAKDDVYAAAPYCPITNLDNSDTAYEWQFNHVSTCEIPPGTVDKDVSNTLKLFFPYYVNSLGLKNPKDGSLLKLNPDGSGPFKEYVKSWLIAAFQEALDKGENLSGYTWLTISGGKVTGIDFERFVEEYTIRMKPAPSFDNLTATSWENNLFGDKDNPNKHFTYFSYTFSQVENPLLADEKIIKMMNPMYYIDDSQAKVAKYWRIRHGAKDGHTSFAIPVILATKLMNKGYEVDFKLPWDQEHGGYYDYKELIEWIEDVVKKAEAGGGGCNVSSTTSGLSYLLLLIPLAIVIKRKIR